MSKRNRKHRNKKRPPSPSGSGVSGSGLSAALLVRERTPQLLQAAGLARARGQDLAAQQCLNELSSEPFLSARAVAATAATELLEAAVATAWTNGWLPDDLCQVVRRKASDAQAEDLIAGAIVRQTAEFSSASLHPRWQAQLAALDVGDWVRTSSPYLDRWGHRRGLRWTQTLDVAVDALSAVFTLDAVEPILPLPGTYRATGTARRTGIDPKVLARVRGLLAKAEATEFAEEAEALSAKAQELMSRHSIEHAMLDATDVGATQTAAARRLWLDAPYVSAKSLLVGAIAAANRCRAVFTERPGFVTVVGDEVDLDIVEVLTTSLLVQAGKAMLSAGQRGRSTRSFRHAFLVAYASRIGERLTEVTQHTTAAAANHEWLLPVLADRDEATESLLGKLFPATRSRSVSVGNGAGWQAGRAAADLAVLDVHRRLE